MTYIEEAKAAAQELIREAKLCKGMIVVIGCSTSEVLGEKIGTDSSYEVAESIWSVLHRTFSEQGIYLAAQCCEHLNRAIIMEKAAIGGMDIVNVVPQPKAGGSMATAAYRSFTEPVAVEHIRADAGLDIGNTLIGMHLKEVAVPLRLSVKMIGKAPLVAARTRPKCIGGIRAIYDDSLM